MKVAMQLRRRRYLRLISVGRTLAGLLSLHSGYDVGDMPELDIFLQGEGQTDQSPWLITGVAGVN